MRPVFLHSLAFIATILGSLLLQAFSPLSQIRVTHDEVVLQLPGGILFQISAESAAEITQIALRYGTNALSCQSGTARHTVEIEPGRAVEAGWEWKFRRSGILPPGAEVWWQWEIKDAAGNTLLTERKTQTIQDQRHSWRQVESQGITVQWYSGDSEFAEELLSIAGRSLERLMQEMELTSQQPVWITVYPTSDEIQEALVRSTEWTGGVAFAEYGSILIAASPDQTAWAEDVIPHELAHIVVRATIFNCRGGSLPTWLSEGLAVYAEGEVSELDRNLIREALENGELPRLATLESGFSAYEEQARLAYAQSAVMVDFMIERYGAEKMDELLASIREGMTITEALNRAYGMDTQEIDDAWRLSLGYETPAGRAISPAQEATPTRVPTLSLWTPVVRAESTPASSAAATLTPTTLPTDASSTPATTSPTLNPTPTPAAGSKDTASPWLWAGLLAIVAVGAGLIMTRVLARRR